MFRFLLKVGALAGSLGIGYQYVDLSSLESAMDSIGNLRQVMSGKAEAGKADTGHEVARGKAEKRGIRNVVWKALGAVQAPEVEIQAKSPASSFLASVGRYGPYSSTASS